MEEDHFIKIPGSIITTSTQVGYLHLQTDLLPDNSIVLTIGVVIDVQLKIDQGSVKMQVKRKASRKFPSDQLTKNDIEILFNDHAFTKVNKCESPLEAHFYIFALDTFTNLEPQFAVDHYRLDFAIPKEKVAIEIDGHEFHKTKEQRTKDAKRERYLQLQGWKVIRFTGTEIFENVIRCVEEVKKLVTVFEKKPDKWSYS
jgi:very-short-patch-repair endonuclease